MARRAGGRGKAENRDQPRLAALEALLGHRFQRADLLTLALTHRSFVYDAVPSAPDENAREAVRADLADPSQDNEQLEFVGDAVLGLLAAEALCRRFPASREGELTRLRASVVSRKHLGGVGARLGLGQWLRLGHTAEKNQARTNPALFSNAVEALIAALYLDGGLEVARRFVERHVLDAAFPDLEQSLTAGQGLSGSVGDHKTALQEILQARGLGRPQYLLLGESGPAHHRLFRIEVRLEGDPSLAAPLAEAEGSTKKQAQQEAARLALTRLPEHLAAHPGAERD